MKKWFGVIVFLVALGVWGVVGMGKYQVYKNNQEAKRLLEVWESTALIHAITKLRPAIVVTVSKADEAMARIEEAIQIEKSRKSRLPKLQAIVLKAMTGYRDILQQREKFENTPSWMKEIQVKIGANRRRQFREMRIALCEYAMAPESELHFGRVKDTESEREAFLYYYDPATQGDPAGYTLTFIARECQAGRKRPEEVVSDAYFPIW
jgi:hypothetical protein